MHRAAGRTDAMDRKMPRIFVRLTLFRRRLVAAAVLAAALAVPALAQAQVVVVANGLPITAYDIEQRTKLVESSEHKKVTRQEILQQLIDDRLKIAKAKFYGFEIPETEVDQAFGNMATRQHITPQQFAQFLQRSGISPDTVKARIRAEITWGQLVRGKFSASLQVGDADVAHAMRERNEAADVVGYIYTLYPVTVVVPNGSNAAAVEAKKREADQLRGRFLNCKQGLEFARALRDVAVRDLISRSSADLAPALRDLLASMEIGRLTSPEVTAQGIQMFAVCDRKASKSDSPAQHQAREEIFQRRFAKEAQRYLDELRKSAMIEYKDAKDAKAK